MSTNKQALREAAEKALSAHARLALVESVFTDDGDVIPEARADIKTCTQFNDMSNPATVLALLDELEKWQQESSAWQAVAEKQLAIATEAEKRIAELTGNHIAWESTTPVYVKFITDERYQKLRPGYQKWYKPYRCSNCAAGISVKGE